MSGIRAGKGRLGGMDDDRDGIADAVHSVGQAHQRRQVRVDSGQQHPGVPEAQIGGSAM